MLDNSNRILFADEAQNTGIAVATARLCNEVCGPKTLELTTRFNAKLY